MGTLSDLAFMGGGEIENREERGIRGSVSPVCFIAGFVPRLRCCIEVVILFDVVAAIVSLLAQQLGQQERIRFACAATSHIRGPERSRIHTGDNRGTGGGADRRIRPTVIESQSFGSERVDVGAGSEGIAIATELRSVVLGSDPEDIRSQIVLVLPKNGLRKQNDQDTETEEIQTPGEVH